MRAFALMIAAVLAAMPIAASVAHADGIERPHAVRHHRPRPPHHADSMGRPAAAAPVPVTRGPEVVTLPAAFFAGGGGVGTDIGTAAVYSSTVIIRGGRASATASASSRSGAGGCGCR